MWLDVGSYVGTDYFINKAKTTETIRFYGVPTINTLENSLVFKGGSYGVYNATNLGNEYTVLVLASYFGTKPENDIIGTGAGTYHMLMMNFDKRTRCHQWGSNGALYQIDSTNAISKLFIGQRYSGTGVLSLIEDGLISKSTNGVTTPIPKTIYIGARFGAYGNGFLDGRIKCFKIFNKALTNAEVYREYQRMIIRYN